MIVSKAMARTKKADVDRQGIWVTIDQAAEILGVNPRTVRRYIQSGRLEVTRLSNKVVRIRLSDLDALIDANLVRGRREPKSVDLRPVSKERRGQAVAKPAKRAEWTPHVVK